MVEIVLVPSSPQWPVDFRRERDRIVAALGDRVLRIEHTGSTSVPGLAAKPIIDITMEVDDTDDEDAYVPQLESLGYEVRVREPEWFRHRCLRHPDGPTVNLHVFPRDCPETETMILFRDHLRGHHEDRRSYERTKRALAERKWDAVQDYADAKSEVVAEIMARARAAVR